MKLWIGKEKEGYRIGEKTLFIGSDKVTAKEILEIDKKYPSLLNLYFGAGGCTKPNFKVMSQVIKKTECAIILEVTIDKVRFVPESIMCGINLVININIPCVNSLKGKLQENYMTIKLESTGRSKGIVCFDIEEAVWTNISLLKGKKYLGDKVIR